MSLFSKTLFQFFLPPQCYCCETFLPGGQQGLCADCLSAVHWIEPPFCAQCGIPFPSREEKNHLCGVCSEGSRYFTIGRSLGCYEGPLREAIRRWKYEGKVHLSPLFGEWMAKGFFRYWDPNLFDLLIPVPLHSRRLRERGFNQALLLVKELSLRTGVSYRKRVLEKKKSTAPQVDLSGQERARGLKGAFHLTGVEEVKEKAILLVDDVYTTGTTVNECSRVLMAGGAKRVDVFTIAHTIMNP